MTPFKSERKGHCGFLLLAAQLFQTVGTATSEKAKQIALPVSTIYQLKLMDACEREVTTLRHRRRSLA
jgi:hypothetical protein